MTAAVHFFRDCSNWRDVRAGIDGLPSTKQKGDCFEFLVKHYLTIEPKYATKLRSVWLLTEVPTNVRKKLNLPETDEGIDLVAETNDGQFWAIQAKFRSNQKQSLTRRELATFTDLAFSICNGFNLALVCTTTDRLSKKLQFHGDRLTFCAGDVWRNLDDEFFQRLHSLLDDRLAPPEPYSPRPHQEQAITNAAEHYIKNGESRGKLIMPCGTGKSLTAFWIAQELKAKTILIAVPSLALVRQTLAVWARECLAQGIDVHWIAVCSDPTVGDPQHDDAAVLTQDLGVDIQTDPTQIAHWLARGGSQSKIVFATYQSGRAISEAAQQSDTEFDLVILDEAHRTVGKRSSLFSHLLFDENLKASRRLAMTATERRYSGRSDKIIGMDDVDLYGSTFEMLSFNAALEADPPILSDYQIVTIFVTREEIDDLIQRNLFVKPDRGKWNNEIEAQMLSTLVALRKAMQKFPISHALSFHSSIAKAKAFSKNQDLFTGAFNNYGELDVFHVSGKTKTAIREKIMSEFAKSARALVSNARCLSEGVDVPDIDCVLFGDPKRSTVDIVQAVGRALRPSEDGSISYIVVPVEIEDIDDDTELQEAVFGSVLSILRALASNDERIVEYFRTVAAGNPWSGGHIPFELVLPDSVRIDSEAFVRAIELKCWSKLGKLSWQPYEEAQEFAVSLGLESELEWRLYCSKHFSELPPRPPDIPSAPDVTYKGRGWTNFSDWLGYAPFRAETWRTFEDSREFARSLELKGRREWMDFATGRLTLSIEKPADIPTSPNALYRKSGWKGWSDFLGTGNIAPHSIQYRPFTEARSFARDLKLNNKREWKNYTRGLRTDLPPLPNDIPAEPYRFYAGKGYTTLGDWLGTGYVRGQERVFLRFLDARKFARGLGLGSSSEWLKFAAGRIPGMAPRPAKIPHNPRKIYADSGWTNWQNWLGCGKDTGKVKRTRKLAKRWRPFEEARRFVHALELKSIVDWTAYCHGDIVCGNPRPTDIPVQPNTVYKDRGWVDWYDWLGKEKRAYRPFRQARAFARSLGLRSGREWESYYRRELPEFNECPKDLPREPDKKYADQGWISWPDWLGYEERWRLFVEAREFARSLDLRGLIDWKSYCRGYLPDKEPRPHDIPASPEKVYKNKGWAGWPDWLGYDQ